MRIAHLSDTHLGHRGIGFQRLVADPWRRTDSLRQQEADIQRGLMLTVDHLLRDPLPDLVIHSGDLFDSSRPTPYNLNFAMAQFARLSAADIPVVIIEGTHSWPRDRGHGHALQLLTHLHGVTVVYDDAAEIRLPGFAISALPHAAVARGIQPSVIAREGGEAAILVGHGVADGNHLFKTGRVAPEVMIAPCADAYDYVALGHCHRFSQIPGTTRAFYAGATAMVFPGDFRPGHRFGFNIVNLGAGMPSVVRHELDTRPMQAYGLDEAEGLAATEVLEFLARQASAAPPDDTYCRVVVEQLDPLARRELSTSAIEEIFSTAAGRTISIRAREQHWEAIQADMLAGGGPPTRFAHLAANVDGDEGFRADVAALGQDLLSRAAERIAQDEVGAANTTGNGEDA